MLDGLRAALNEVGLTPFDIRAAGRGPGRGPLEGALQVRDHGGRFILETVDYGQAFRLLDAGSEREIKEAVIGYVSRPLPPVRPMARRELDTLLGRIAGHYGNFLNDLRAAGPPGFVIDLPPWFGRPGGGIRFTLQQPATGLGDLVVSGRLQRVHVTG